MPTLSDLAHIQHIKDIFESTLCRYLSLWPVSCPLFVLPETGLNDGLCGTEKAVSFSPPSLGKKVEIVHSLAKWKRSTLGAISAEAGKGLLTRMSAIRQDEVPDATHSYLVSQFDWEKVITQEQRTIEFLKETVRSIYDAVRCVYRLEHGEKTDHNPLPNHELTFFTTQELEDMYPLMTPEERETEICRIHGAVGILGIGHKLVSGAPHGIRAPDYDDWDLNADLLIWHAPLQKALELSSMGIRVDADALRRQYETLGQSVPDTPYHQGILTGTLPLTIGGGIGQDRIAMFVLGKSHIRDVQCSVWP